MKDKIYLSPNFIEEKVKKIFEMSDEICFIARFGLLSRLREQEIIYIKKRFVVMAMVVTVKVCIKLIVKMD